MQEIDVIVPFVNTSIDYFKGGEIKVAQIDNLIDGNFFKRYNSKVLGEQVLKQDRYGKQIIVVQGDIRNLDEIIAPDNFEQFLIEDDSASSRKNESIEKQTEDPDNESFIENIIADSEQSISRKQTRFTEDYNIQSVEQVYAKLNPDISEEELRVYLWYKDKLGQRFSDTWYKIANLNGYVNFPEQQIIEWVENGLLYYFDGELLPEVIYLSGDLYEKITRLITAGPNSGMDAAIITEKYGDQVLKNQIQKCNLAYDKVYTSRLVITGNRDGNSLILKPISSICTETMVSELQEYERFSWYATKGKPNWLKMDGRSKDDFSELSITDAFCFWLVTNKGRIEIRGGITFLDIIELYIMKKTRQSPRDLAENEKDKFKAMLERSKAKAREEGDRLFLKFLDEQLVLNDKIKLETLWNRKFNNYLPPNYQKIPVAFNIAQNFYGEEPFIIKPEKREAVSFILNEGAGCLTYDVGVGKTMSAIMTAEQFLVAGYCSRPFIVVPNQTYEQWLSEISALLPHRKVNGFFNLGDDYLEEAASNTSGEWTANLVESGSITVMTYEGLKRLGFNDLTSDRILSELYAILNQGDAEKQMSKRKKAGFLEKLESLIGRGLKGSFLNIEDFGFDFMTVDEAHSMKKIFTSVKGSVEEATGKRDRKKHYDISSGLPSDLALKGFMMAQYIFKNNNNRNVVLLTATPFQNSPLEVFSMLSLVAYGKLSEVGLNNINSFFDNFIEVSNELTINHKLKPVFKQVVLGFENLPALQKIITRFFNYKTGEDVGVVRPSKYVLPYTKTIIDGIVTDLPKEERIETYLRPSDIQKVYMDRIIAFAENKLQYEDLIAGFDYEDEDEEADVSPSVELEIASLDRESMDKARAIISTNLSRAVALSPYLYKFNDIGVPSAVDFVEKSPKIHLTMLCIQSVIDYHNQNNQSVSGQIIYMNRGVEYFNLLKKYLVDIVGLKSHEVGIITSKGMNNKKRTAVQDAFLGRKFNIRTNKYEPIADSERIKVLIGSSSIKEGMNLQKHSTVLYDLYLSWNPTDKTQIDGRAWRQGNIYKNVRLMNPLLFDSADIFMFQKLAEKTARINTIWSNDGRSALRLDEFDPEQLKKSLIRDPKVLAKIEVLETKTRLEDDKKFNISIIDRLNDYQSAKDDVVSMRQQIYDDYKRWNQSKTPLDLFETLSKLKSLYSSRQPKDRDGLPIISNFERENIPFVERSKYSSVNKPYKPYWFDRVVLAERLIKKEQRDLLNPRQLLDDEIKEYINELNSKNLEITRELEFLESEEYLDRKSIEIEQLREKNAAKPKSVDQVAKDFSKLNYLLDFKYCNLLPSPEKKSDERIEIELAIDQLLEVIVMFDGEEKNEIQSAIDNLNDVKELF